MKSNNQINIPEAKNAMEQFKMQAAQEVGVNLQNGYNGHLTSREAGSVGGQMVKKMCPIRTAKYDRHNRIALGHVQTVQYIAAITVQGGTTDAQENNQRSLRQGIQLKS